ncbi:MAG: hypothetical protein K2P98_05115 [Neisseriaceae bacterium]|nr:hypothetical protein [Neisseriaceae bacterium]
MDIVLEEIAKCSEKLSFVEFVWDVFYVPFNEGTVYPNKWRNILKDTEEAMDNWLDRLFSESAYNVCIVTAAVKWRSVIELQLMGIKKAPESAL